MVPKIQLSFVVFLSFTITVGCARKLTVKLTAMDLVRNVFGLGNDDLRQFVSQSDFTNFKSFSNAILEEKSDREHWNTAAESLGRSLAELHLQTRINSVNDAKAQHLKDIFVSRTPLEMWLLNAPPGNIASDVISESLFNLGQERSIVVGDLSLSNVNYDNRHITLSPHIGNGKVDVSEILADLIVHYHESVAKRTIANIPDEQRVCDVQLASVASKFGQSYETTMNLSESERKIFWKKTAKLVALDVIRRCILMQQDVNSYQTRSGFGVKDCLEAANRIMQNERIESVHFMFFVGLALG